jgi:hypothetical protein
MKHRKLRIAWSVGWGMVAVLLCVLWVRSYWRSDVIEGPLSRTTRVSAESRYGGLSLGYSRGNFGEWYAQSYSPAYGWTNEQIQFGARPPHLFVRLPYVLIISVMAMVATLPWITLSKRFSLRTLLIATTLIAVVLAVWAWSLR